MRNEELNDSYCSPNSQVIKNKKNEMGEACGTCGGERCKKRSSLRKSREKPLVRSKHRREDNIKMDFKEIVLKDIDQIDLPQYMDKWLAVVNSVLKPP